MADPKMLKTEEFDRLDDIMREMRELLEEAHDLMKGTSEAGRMEAYWYPQILMHLTEEHGYLGGSMYPMYKAVEKLWTQGDENPCEVCGNQDFPDTEKKYIEGNLLAEGCKNCGLNGEGTRCLNFERR